MSLQKPSSTSLIERLIASPDVVRTVRSLNEQAFSALVRHIGVEDAGEIVAMATTSQLVAAFDEDLFVANAPGQREALDRHRFALWLEVLLEAGDEAAARRVTELSEDFVVHALSQMLLVLDQDALFARMAWDDSEAPRLVDKALESSLTESIDGYLLVARVSEGWDAVMSLILALDRDHRRLLERILDRCANLERDLVYDFEALYDVLSSTEALAEDVEAEREERRFQVGHVEPRGARGFLALAKIPPEELEYTGRDATTNSYFRTRERERKKAAKRRPAVATSLQGEVADALAEDLPRVLAALESSQGAMAIDESASGGEVNLIECLRGLAESEPDVFDQRMEEIAYLANTLLAGADLEGRRMRPAEAGDAALATTALGLELEARHRGHSEPSHEDLRAVLRDCPADLLFRRASATLAASHLPSRDFAFLLRREDVMTVLRDLQSAAGVDE